MSEELLHDPKMRKPDLTETTGAASTDSLDKNPNIVVKTPRPRWMLHIQAQFWRYLMGIGMFLHKFASPRPLKPKFKRMIPTTVSPMQGHIALHFYVPKDYEARKATEENLYPVVINFHGGGFTLGKATDDARWCTTVVEEIDAVVVSVDYRLAPEHPFPTAVEDGVDAILYLVQNFRDLHIDKEKIALSGFSSGANMCFTVPLRLLEELDMEADKHEERHMSVVEGRRPALQKAVSDGRVLTKGRAGISIKAICTWYPPTDYTHTREQRKATCARLDQQLPSVFTDLFDESYLQPPTMDMSDPYLSPGCAPDYMLAGLPQETIMFTCEWDMLLKEGEDFRDRLRALGKTVHYQMVPEAPHGWDKAPNPIKPTPGVREHYLDACKEMKRLLRVTPAAAAVDETISSED